MSIMQLWWKAIRPWSYTAAIVPVALGGVMAAYDGHFDAFLFALILVGSIAIQAGANLVNDYYDYTRGTDNPQVFGTGGALLRGDFSPRQILIGGVVALAFGSLIGLYLAWVSGPFIFWLGVFSVACAFFYTAGPFALAYNALGEIAVFIFMGPVMVVGTHYVMGRSLEEVGRIILAALPISFLVAAILHANNQRDLYNDRKVGKRTMATVLGRSGARIEYYVLTYGAFVAQAVTLVLGITPWPTLITLLTLPLNIKLARIVAAEDEAEKLQPVLRQTAVLHWRFGLLLTVGWAIALGLQSWLK